MGKGRGIFIVLLIVGLLLFTACDNPLTRFFKGSEDAEDVGNLDFGGQSGRTDGLRETVLYYQDEEGILIPVMREIPWEEGIAKAALEYLIVQPHLDEELAAEGLKPTFPQGTEIIGMTINEGLCKVDFNDALLDYETEAEENALVQSLVYTLTEFETINQVQLLINGKTVNQLKFGTEAKLPFVREDINLSAVISDEMIPVIVYYKSSPDGVNSYYVPVTKGVEGIKADIKTVLESLLEGAPENSGLYSEIPQGVQVEDVYVKDSVAYVELSEEIKRLPSNETLQQSMVYEIGLTLKEVEPTITQVRILSGGKEIPLGAGVTLNLPVYSNAR